MSTALLFEVLPAQDCIPSADLPPAFAGRVRVRGRWVPVAFLHSLVSRPGERGEFTYVVVVDTGKASLGVAVAGLGGITAIDEAEIAMPEAGGAAAVAGLWSRDGETVRILDPRAFDAPADPRPGEPGAAATPETHGAGVRGYCLFERRGRRFAIAVERTREVVSPGRVTAVPLTADPVAGIIAVRGEPVALIDADRILGLERDGGGREPTAGEALVVDAADGPFALLVDRVTEVRPAAPEEIRSPASGAAAGVLAGILSLADAEVGVLDPNRLATRVAADVARHYRSHAAFGRGREEDADGVADASS